MVLFALPTWHGSAQTPDVAEKSLAKAGRNAQPQKTAVDSPAKPKASQEIATSPRQAVKVNTAPLTAPPAVEFHPQPSEVEQKVFDKLNQSVTVDVKNQTMQGLLAELADRYSLNILVDDEKLEEESLTTAADVKAVRFTGVTLRSALKVILERSKLGFYVEDEIVKVTTLTELGLSKWWTRTYPVGDLVCDNDDLIVLTFAIKEIVTPGNWGEDDPHSSQITSVPSVGTLVVRHTLTGHEQVLNLVRALRKTKAESGVFKGLSKPSGTSAAVSGVERESVRDRTAKVKAGGVGGGGGGFF